MFQGLEHTAIASPDPRKLAQWYVDNLEFQINFSYDVFYFVKAREPAFLPAFLASPDGIALGVPPVLQSVA